MTDQNQKLRTVADSELTLTQYMQPEHSNSLGSVHGAARHPQGMKGQAAAEQASGVPHGSGSARP